VHPILFIAAGKPIYASQVFLGLALVIGFFVSRHEIRRREISGKVFYLYWVLAVPAALLLAAFNSALFHNRLWEVIANPSELISTGLVSFGAVIGALGLGLLIARANKIPAFHLLDVISIILPLILGVYRIGCMLNGCCYGRETEGVFGFYLPNAAGQWANRYPTQIMLLVFDLALFFFLWRWRRKNPAEGKTTLVFLLSFSIFRLLLDKLRELPMINDRINILQLGSLTLLLITLSALFAIRLGKPSREESKE